MKKTLSIILAILMIVSAIPMAFAADAAEPLTITSDTGDSVTLYGTSNEQNLIDVATESIKNAIDDIKTDIESGEADYTAIDEAIAEIEQKIADNNVTDENKAELEAIKTELEELKADSNSSEADIDELMEKLDTFEEALDNGITDGTWLEKAATPDDTTECENCDGSLSACETLLRLSDDGMFGRFFSWLHILLHFFVALF